MVSITLHSTSQKSDLIFLDRISISYLINEEHKSNVIKFLTCIRDSCSGVNGLPIPNFNIYFFLKCFLYNITIVITATPIEHRRDTILSNHSILSIHAGMAKNILATKPEIPF
jgi:hypothetical protein